MANTMALTMGIAFTLISLLGFVAPAAGGLHLSPAHTLIHLCAAIAALFFGLIATGRGARTFCFTLGGAFVLVGFLGFVFGTSQATTLTGVEPAVNSALWMAIPGHIEFGYRDHILHLISGAMLVAGGAFSDLRRGTRAEANREDLERQRKSRLRNNLRKAPR